MVQWSERHLQREIIMSLIKKLEEAAAKKLMRLFLDSKKYADHAIEDLEKAEKTVETARIKAVEATQRQHEAAVEAAQKAKDVADQLALEARVAEQRVIQYEEKLKYSRDM